MTMSAICKRAALLWVFLLAACTIQLVPAYDQALVEGLDSANAAALTLFAAVENGSPKDEYSELADDYSEVIGSFQSLQQRAANRQVPPLAKRLSQTRFVSAICNVESDPTGCVNVTPQSLEAVLAQLRGMRNRHQAAGLDKDSVERFREAYDPAIAQALFIENALKR